LSRYVQDFGICSLPVQGVKGSGFVHFVGAQYVKRFVHYELKGWREVSPWVGHSTSTSLVWKGSVQEARDISTYAYMNTPKKNSMLTGLEVMIHFT